VVRLSSFQLVKSNKSHGFKNFHRKKEENFQTERKRTSKSVPGRVGSRSTGAGRRRHRRGCGRRGSLQRARLQINSRRINKKSVDKNGNPKKNQKNQMLAKAHIKNYFKPYEIIWFKY
jgi:hypothetical protein